MSIAISQNSAASYSAATTNSSTSSASEGSTEFYKLLTTQLTNQNPLEPMKETDFLGQMAQFSSVEQLEALTSGMQQSQADQRWLSSQNLLGREVVWQTSEDALKQEGTVDRVFRNEDGIWLQIGEQTVSPESVQSVGGQGSNGFNLGVF